MSFAKIKVNDTEIVSVDNEPLVNSQNLITSGGVHEAIGSGEIDYQYINNIKISDYGYTGSRVYSVADGSIISSGGPNLNDKICEEYFMVTPEGRIGISGLRTRTDAWATYVFYDANKNFVSAGNTQYGWLDVPSNAKYVRFGGIDVFANKSMAYGIVLDDNIKDTDALTTLYDSYINHQILKKQLEVKGIVSSKFLKNDGTMQGNDNGCYYIYDVQAGKKYYITSNIVGVAIGGGAYFSTYWFVDANGVMIEAGAVGTGETDIPPFVVDYPVTAPVGAVQIYVQNLTASPESKVIAQYTTDEFIDLMFDDDSLLEYLNAVVASDNVELNIPDEINVIAGRNFQIFKYPLTLRSDYADYGVSISSSNTTALDCDGCHRFALIKPKSAGNNTLNIVVTNDKLQVLVDKNVVVHAITPSSPSSMKNILLVGDSETYGVGGIPYGEEVKRLLTSNDVETTTLPAGLGLTNLQLIGSVNPGARHEGYGGRTASWFVGSESPFYKDGAIDFNKYLAGSIYDNDNYKGIDLIYITLGINDKYNVLINNGKITFDYRAHAEGLISLLTYIKNQIVEGTGNTYYNPNLKVILLSYVFSDTDGYDLETTKNDKYSDGTLMAQRYLACAKVNALVASMPEFSSFVKAKILSSMIDSENAYSKQQNAVKSNPYMDTYEDNTTQGVHPNTIGYRMFGATVANDILGEV